MYTGKKRKKPLPLMLYFMSESVYCYSNIYPTRFNVTQFILSGNCSTCFGWYHNPASGAQTVSTASGICHTVIALSVLWVVYAITV